MQKNEKYKQLSDLAKNFTLLYVEDNIGLQKQASTIFHKFFPTLITANNGNEGLELFKKHNPDIVITDIKMPYLDGLEMVESIRALNTDAQIIITSAYDDKENLLKAIDVGVNKYLKKPIAIDILVETLLNIIEKITNYRNQNIFNHYINEVFQNQDIMLMLLENNEPLIVNKKALEFFSQKNIEDFKAFFKDFGKLLLTHNNFLYNQEGIEWLDTIKLHVGKLFNVKIINKDGNSRHFILKAYEVTDKKNYFVLSFDDITELNLLAIYDKNAVENEDKIKEKETIRNLLEIIKRNKSQISLYNSYKGLNISNKGVTISMNKEEIVIQTSYLQQRAIAINKYCIIESEVFPKAINCELKNINYENQEVTLENLVFTDFSPSEQRNIRVEPEQMHKISLFVNKIRLPIDLKILDISIESIRIYMEVVPPKLQEAEDIRVNIVLNDTKIPLIVDLDVTICKLKELNKNFEAICYFKDPLKAKKMLVNYISKRQMALIREFKGLGNG